MDESKGLISSESEQKASFRGDVLSTAKGSSIVAVGRLFNYGGRIVITFVIVRLLNAEQYGLYNIAISVTTIAAAIALFGLDTTLTRQIAVMKGRRDQAGLWGTIQIGLSLGLLLSTLLSIILFALSYPIATQIFNEPRLAPLLQLSCLFVPSLTMGDALAGATRGFKNMRDMVVSQNIVQPIVRLLLVGGLAFFRFNIFHAIIAYGVADVVSTLMLVYYLNRHFPLKRSLRGARRDTKAILSFTFPVWLTGMMSTFRGNIQTLLLGSLTTVVNVGIFSVASQLNLLGSIFHASITTSSRPLIAELHDRNDWSRLGRLYQTTTRWVVILNLPFILLMMLIPAQLLSLFGKSFVDGAVALRVLAFVSLVNAGTGMCGAVLEMTGHTTLKLINAIIRLILSVVLNLLLIPRWGLLGAAITALIIESVANILPLIQVWNLYRLLPYSRDLVAPIVGGIAAAAAFALLALKFPPENSLIHTVFLILLSFGVYLAVILSLGVSAEELILLVRSRNRVSALLSRLSNKS
ncbi:MAG: flippase [Chloroflexi bacterium]|nr:flippase [Chloroflexota bacterium]